jgi:CarboxypepD_reg-like domain/TonB-dependent Receptor Plug Domain
LKRFLLAFLVFASLSSYAQSVLDSKLDGSEKGKTLAAVFEDIEKKQPVRFYYLTEWVEGISLDDTFAGKTLRETLDELFLGSDLNFVEINPHAIVLVKDPTQALQRNTMINTAVRERKKIEKVLIGDPKKAKSKQRVSLTGVVTDAKSKDPLVGVNVLVSDIQIGTVTNAEGRFELKMPSGTHILNFSYVNFEEKVIDLSIFTDGDASLELEEMPTLLDEVVVQDMAAREITTSRIGQTQISIKEIKRAPALLGEVDLIKQIQVLPGVTTAGEAASGFNVRGGGVDQNLILYDGLPVFNSSHVFGFFSSFNAEAIRDVSFYRGGIPAEYGGRVSSVLDIRSKEGDYEKWRAGGGIGMISSNLFVSGPIKKEKTSVAASLRSTYSDWLINTVKTNYVDLQNSSVAFYDGALKLTHNFSDNTKLTFSGYTSKDQFRLQGDTTYSWNNMLGSVRLDHQISQRMGSNLILGWGSYGYKVNDRDPRSGFDLAYKITYPTLKMDFHYQGGAHRLSFGLHSNYYKFYPGKLTPSSQESAIRSIEMAQQRSLESALYFGDGYTINEKMFVEAGLRLSVFNSLGPATISLYDPNLPRETYNQIGSEEHAKGDIYKTYVGPEPRASFRYTLNSSSSIKAGYNRIYQYLHLVTNTTAVTPVDIWQPSNPYFKPQLADQYSLGYFKNFKDKTFEAFVEVYYKTIDNILDFKDGAQLILNPNLETDLLQGKGTAYGFETSVGKSVGRLSGSVNYTYSRSLRQIAGRSSEESVNEGKEYASNFDQPHIVNLTWKYNLSRRYFFTGNFTYHTGRPVTLPLSGYLVDNMPVSNFSDRNQYRVPDYHRLDFALVIEGNHKRKKFWDGTWAISVYNVYARKNAYSVFFKDDGNGVLRPYKLAIIGTVLPSISYNFKI